MYLANGDFQLANTCNELDDNLAVCGGAYCYKLTPEDIAKEQSAFEPAPDVSIHFLPGIMSCLESLDIKSLLFLCRSKSWCVTLGCIYQVQI